MKKEAFALGMLFLCAGLLAQEVSIPVLTNNSVLL
jgi:hypothetical protein